MEHLIALAQATPSPFDSLASALEDIANSPKYNLIRSVIGWLMGIVGLIRIFGPLALDYYRYRKSLKSDDDDGGRERQSTEMLLKIAREEIFDQHVEITALKAQIEEMRAHFETRIADLTEECANERAEWATERMQLLTAINQLTHRSENA